MLGSRPVERVVDHASAFVTALDQIPAGATVVDLGSGGGVPGLVVAWCRDDLHTVLVERRATRADHLRRLVRRLDLGDRADVVEADATRLRGLPPAAATMARGFGTPRSVLTTARRLLAPGGLAVVAEPPEIDPRRWPDELLLETAMVRLTHPDRRVALFRRRPPNVSRESEGSATAAVNDVYTAGPWPRS